jgi:Abortive infection alpha
MNVTINVSADKAAEEVADLIRDSGRLITPVWQPLVGLLSDQLEVLRLKNQAKIFQSYREFLLRRGLSAPTREVSPAFLVPWIEHASLETGDDLQGVWAMMLANASDGNSASSGTAAFVSMLSQMSHLDVLNLSKIDECAAGKFEWVNTLGLPDSALIAGRGGASSAGGLPSESVQVSLYNLFRLGCILLKTNPYSGPNYHLAKLTPLGLAFTQVCSAPKNA